MVSFSDAACPTCHHPDWTVLTHRLFDRFEAEYRKCPQAEVVDYYKLLYQACLGPGHGIRSPEQFTDWVLREFYDESTIASVSPIEDITIVHPVARVHFAAVRALGIGAHVVAKRCLEFATEFVPADRITWIALVNELLVVLSGDPFRFPIDTIKSFLVWIIDSNYPACHHSERYRLLIQPHYRLIHPAAVDFPPVNR